MNDTEINDIRPINEFKSKSFSKYSRFKVKSELLNSLYSSNIEPACNWSVELICAGHYQDLWEIIIHFMSRYIQLGNPKLPLYIERRFQNFRNIISNGYTDNILPLRNNPKIRKLFAEIICILCLSRKKHAFESLTIKDSKDFEITNLTRRLKAPDISFVQSIFNKDDPKELFIAINEFKFHISESSKDITAACYWFEWILQYEIICKQKKLHCHCERRTFAPVDEKLQMDIIWIIWDALLHEANNKSFEFYKNIINSLLNLFCIKYTSGCKRRRKYIIYLAISFLTESINLNIPLIENKQIIESITQKIYVIYKDIKKNEIAPKTDYLFLSAEKSNLDKTIEKLEKINNIDNLIPQNES